MNEDYVLIGCELCSKALQERWERNRERCLDCYVKEIVEQEINNALSAYNDRIEEKIAKEISYHLVEEHGYDD